MEIFHRTVFALSARIVKIYKQKKKKKKGNRSFEARKTTTFFRVYDCRDLVSSSKSKKGFAYDNASSFQHGCKTGTETGFSPVIISIGRRAGLKMAANERIRLGDKIAWKIIELYLINYKSENYVTRT